jgi:acetolactate synthase-1/3 small subunit
MVNKEVRDMRHTVIAWLEDKPGVLNRVVGLFRRRNFNIESLTVGHSETPDISRMTVVVSGDERVVEQVERQLFKLINVTDVKNVTAMSSVVRELALIKVHADAASRSEILQFANIYRARVVDVCADALIIEITGPEERIDSLVELLRPFDIKEIVRTGRVAMVRGNNGY